MELRQLEYFIQICKSGSFTKAKEELGVTQPTLSQQIRVLEDEYNIQLFDRVSRGVEVTEAGKILLNKGKAIMNLLEEARNEIDGRNRKSQETISIGCCPAELEYLAPYFMRFHQKYPNVLLKVIDTEDAANKVLEQMVDIGITAYPVSDASVISTHLYRQEMALLVHSEHPLANKSSIPFQSLKQMNSIMFREQNKSLIDMYGFSCGFTLKSIIETSSSSVLIHWVRHGLGAALIPTSLLESLRDDSLRIVKLEGHTPCWDISLVHLNSVTMRSTARVFMQEMDSYVRKLR
ncbi:LysR family transcriptional regulator [Paenibacillus mucilaginosus]|uniref:Transcriptional regulator, LysR family n=1 Tax=Paenibacillus mucilaginosus (strain KNP414) TaxID=1036673 RepID=F8FQN3_PAEMK|nr:LysR family transcriptional regulator [Paenibacillus mucilaginosus]AEI40388.1 transcriptional regulator, LysR family [Paenibacillus mucilaginosus KNP414]MCG7213261.1 LysR family transcriptional regulator [Paenibacillus mucilaginosus]WDM29577.1 LysR family transcriptional regulator [Paenibacillus mucilaginosus]